MKCLQLNCYHHMGNLMGISSGKFPENYKLQRTPEDDQRVQWPKCDYNNQTKDTNLSTSVYNNSDRILLCYTDK